MGDVLMQRDREQRRQQEQDEQGARYESDPREEWLAWMAQCRQYLLLLESEPAGNA